MLVCAVLLRRAPAFSCGAGKRFMPFRVGIIGMGSIASGFDKPEGAEIQTHVKAISLDPRLTLSCVADRNADRARGELVRYGLNARVLSPDEMLSENLDVLCIASPDGSHISYLEAFTGQARLFLCEKPLEGKQADRLGVLSSLESRAATLVMHHQRRWIPGLSDWMAQASAGALGKPLSATGHYTRGLRHNGVHFFDLVAGFLGTDVVWAKRLGEGIADRNAQDLTQSLVMTLNRNGVDVPVTLYGTDGRVQTVFSFDIYYEKARVSIFDQAGIRAELHRPADLGIDGFAPELRPVALFHDDPPHLIGAVWRNIADHLEQGRPLKCAGGDALLAYDLVDEVEAWLAV